MTIEFFDALRTLLIFAAVGPLVAKVLGDFWHDKVEHRGWLGETFRRAHKRHHEMYSGKDFLSNEYHSAHSWSWYVAGGIVGAIMFLTLPRCDAMPLAAGATLFGLFEDGMHQAIHILKKTRFASHPHFREIRHKHLVHHKRLKNFGISTFWLDDLRGTSSDEIPTEQEDLFPPIGAWWAWG